MVEHDFRFCFKGGRSYVHGTDLYNSIYRFLHERFESELTLVNMSIHKRSNRNMLGKLTSATCPLDDIQPSVLVRFQAAGEDYILYLLDTETVVDCRYEYDEEKIVRNGQFLYGSKAIQLRNTTTYSPIEIVVALNKKLMLALFPDGRGKWYFTRLSLLRELPAETSNVDFLIQLENNLGVRLTRSQIFIGDKDFGQIFFSLVDK